MRRRSRRARGGGTGLLRGKLAVVRTPHILLASLLAGCGFGLQPTTPEGIALLLAGGDSGGFSETDADTDTDADADADADIQPEIDSIDPNWGTTAGGTEVVLEGVFGEDATVRMGGVEADNKSVQTKRGILVFFTPEVGDAGVVSIVLESGGESAKLEDSFTYFADGTDLVGAIGSVAWVDIVGNYWVDTPVDFGYGFFVPVIPAEFEWSKLYAGGQDECESSKGGYTYNPSLEAFEMGSGSSVTLSSGAKTIDMPWSASDAQFGADEVVASQFAANSSYDLSETNFSGAEIPEFTVSGILDTPGSFSVSAPAIQGNNAPSVSQNFSVAWSGGSAGDGVLLTLQMMNSAGTTVEESVTCALRDDGAFNVPGGTFKGWAANRQLNIFVSRYKLAQATIDFNNAGTAVMGEYVVYGAAFTK